MPDGKRVALIVDDEPAIREFASLVLQRAGFLTLSACGVNEALQLARDESNRIDVLITDVEMKDGEGIGLAREIHKLRKNIGVLIISGRKEYRERASTSSFEFLPKPFLVNEFLDAVDRIAPHRGQPTP